MIKKIKIAEPWNFKSSDGDNQWIVNCIDEKQDGIIAKTISTYRNIDYIYITKRNTSNSINIYKYDYQNNTVCDFIAIGSFEE